MSHTGLILLIVLLMVQVLNRKLSYTVASKIEKNYIYKCFFLDWCSLFHIVRQNLPVWNENRCQTRILYKQLFSIETAKQGRRGCAERQDDFQYLFCLFPPYYAMIQTPADAVLPDSGGPIPQRPLLFCTDNLQFLLYVQLGQKSNANEFVKWPWGIGHYKGRKLLKNLTRQF